MLIDRGIEQAGIFDSTEIRLLRRVFEQAKGEADSESRLEALASRVIANYMAGITDEAELLALSRQPLGR